METDRSREARLEEAIAGYLDRLNAGVRIEPGEILAAEPELGRDIIEALESFLDLEPALAATSAGETLGDYRIVRQLGRGGMGVVYEAWQESMERRVALKVLPAGLAADGKTLARFLREAKVAAGLDHQHIVRVFGMGVDRDTPHYAMQLVEGETLADEIRHLRGNDHRATELPNLERCLRLAADFAGVAEGLQHAHERKVIHRDLKPSNLIRDREGRLLILDFGLARFEGAEGLTTTGDLVGTLLYMSPEQARAQQIELDHRTDIYSLGATLYEALTLEPPLRGKNRDETLSQIIATDPVPPRRRNVRIPRDLETLVLKCLRKEPDDRYLTAEALAQELRRIVRGDPIEARPQSGWERLWRRAWRYRLRLAAAGGVVMLLVVAAAFGRMVWERRGEERMARYEELLLEGVAGLEAAFHVSPGERDEGETLATGNVYPSGIDGWYGDLDHLQHLYEHAVGALRAAAETAPWQVEAHFHLGRGLLARGDRADAFAALERAATLMPGFIPALVLASRRSQATRSLANPEQLIKTLEAAAGSGWQRLWLEGYRAALAEQWEDVEHTLNALIELGESREPYKGFLLEHLLRRGRVRLRRGKLHEAQRDFLTASVRTPRVAAPLLLVASTYYELKLGDQAALILDEVAARFGTEDAVSAAADIHLHFRETERALALVDTLPPGSRSAVRVKVLRKSGRLLETVAEAREAIARGVGPGIYVDASDALINLKRLDEAEELLREGLKAHPHASELEKLLNGRIAYYRGRLRELLDRELALPLERRSYSTEGWCAYRLGLIEQALAAFSRGLERDPRDGNAWQARAFVKSRAGDLAGAVADNVEGLVLSRGRDHWTRNQLLDLWRPSRRELFAPHWDRIRLAFNEATARRLEQPRAIGLHALSCLYSSAADPAKALELALAAVESSKRCDAEALCRLSEVHLARGELLPALRASEQAWELRSRPGALAEQIRLCRDAFLPALGSVSSVDALLAAVEGEESHSEAAIADARTATARELPAIARYFDACLLERAGDAARAAEALQSLVADGAVEEQGAILRLARLWAHTGRRGEALALIEGRLLERGDETPKAWETWLGIASRGEGSSLGALLARPILGMDAGARRDNASFRGDVRWALECLLQAGAIRINCGGAEYVDPQGHTWSDDRFWNGGAVNARFAPPLTGTADPLLFNANRAFREDYWLTPGYRIPLPCGRYRLTLHFAVTEVNPHPWRFSIVCEDRTLETELDPGEAGVGVVQQKAYEVDVVDGALDLILRPKPWLAFVSAIEVHPAGEVEGDK